MKIQSFTFFGIVLPILCFITGFINLIIQYYLYKGVLPTVYPAWYAFWDLRSGPIGGLTWYVFSYLILFLISCFLEKHGFIKIIFPEVKREE